MPVIRDTVIQFLQQIKGFGESVRQTREPGATMPRLPLTPGAEVLATVTGKLENGMSLVRISSSTFAMDLPAGAKTGDTLRMTFLSQDPRPMFSLSNSTFSAAPVTMSPAGELVRRLLRNPAQDSSARSPLPVMGRLLDAPPGDTTRLAGRLRQALGESGLFYESHLEEWAAGERPMARVMREPQAALSRPEARARAAAMTASTDRPSSGAAVQDGEMPGVPPEDGVAEEIPRPPGGSRSSETGAKETGRMPVETERREGAPVRRDEGGRPAREAAPERRESSGGSAGEPGRRVPGDGFPDTGTGARTPSPSAQQGDHLPKEAAPGPDSALPKSQPTDSGAGTRPAEAPAKETGRTLVETERREGAPAQRDEGGRLAREAAPERRESSGGPAGEPGRRVPGDGFPDTGTGARTPSPSAQQGDHLPKEAAPGPDSAMTKREPTDSGSGARPAEAPAKETGRTPVETERREGAPAWRDEGGRLAREAAPERRESSGGPAGEPGRRVPGDGFPDSGTGARTPSPSAQQGERLPKEAAPGPDSAMTKREPTDSGSGARPAEAPAKETGRMPVETERREGAPAWRDEGGRPAREAAPERRESTGGPAGEPGRRVPGDGFPDTGTGARTPSPSAQQGERLPKEAAPGADSAMTKREPTDSGAGARHGDAPAKESGRTPVETERREGAPAQRDEGGRLAREAAPERRESTGGPAGEPGRRVPGDGFPDSGTGARTPSPSAQQGDHLPREAAPGPDSAMTKREPTDSGSGARPAEAPAKETGRMPVETERREGAPAWRDEGGRLAREAAPERRESSGGPAGEPGRRVPGDGFSDTGTGARTPSPSAQQGDHLPKEAAPGPDSAMTKREPTDSGSGARPAEAPAKETGRMPVETERREGAPAWRDEGGRPAREAAPERRESSGGPAGEPGRRVPGDGFPDSGTGARTPSPSAQQGDHLPKEAAPGPDSPLPKREPTDSGSGARPAEVPAKETGRMPVETERREGASAWRDEGGRSAREPAPERRESFGGPAGETGRSIPGERPTNPSPVREPAADVRGESGRPVMAEAETGPRPGPDPGRTPSALVEQRERLLKETYGRMEDYAIPEKQAQREPVRGPLPGSERMPEFSRTVFPGQDRDVGAEVSRNFAAGDLARLDEPEPADLSPSRIAGQGEIADARTLPLVSRQLNMLNSGLFVWQGEAWPGQTMDWEVEDREANPETGDENGWRTTLRLDLPNLGRVAGVINLSGNELRLSLATDSRQSASLMDVGLGELRERMVNAGIEVKGVVVRHEELEGT